MPVRDASLRGARGAVPEDDLVVGHYRVYRALAALEADRASGIWLVEIGLVRDHRSDEVAILRPGRAQGRCRPYR